MLCAEVVELYFKLYGRKNPILTMSAAVTTAAASATTVRFIIDKIITWPLGITLQSWKKISYLTYLSNSV